MNTPTKDDSTQSKSTQPEENEQVEEKIIKRSYLPDVSDEPDTEPKTEIEDKFEIDTEDKPKPDLTSREVSQMVGEIEKIQQETDERPVAEPKTAEKKAKKPFLRPKDRPKTAPKHEKRSTKGFKLTEKTQKTIEIVAGLENSHEYEVVEEAIKVLVDKRGYGENLEALMEKSR